VTWKCARCKNETRVECPEARSASGEVKTQCAKCGRFAGWVAVVSESGERPPHTEHMQEIQHTPPPVATGQPDAWLYVSKKLDLEWLPNVPMWSGEVISLGSTVYYRLTPQVYAWLDRAGTVLEKAVLAGSRERSQLDAYLVSIRVVWEFAAWYLEWGQVKIALANDVSLPEFTWIK
jgi:hypothetical protein